MFLRCLTLSALIMVPSVAADDIPANQVGWEVERVEVIHEVADGTVVQIDNPFGDVRCRFGGYVGEVELVGMVQHFDSDGTRIEIRSHQDEGVLKIEVFVPGSDEPIRKADPTQRKRADLAIFLPTAVARVEIETDSGAIQLKGVETPAVMRSQSGDFKILAGKARVDAETAHGNMSVTLQRPMLEIGQRLIAPEGSIELRLPTKTPTVIDLLTSGGRIASDFSIEIEETEAGRRGNIRLGSTKPGSLEIVAGTDIGIFALPEG